MFCIAHLIVQQLVNLVIRFLKFGLQAKLLGLLVTQAVMQPHLLNVNSTHKNTNVM